MTEHSAVKGHLHEDREWLYYQRFEEAYMLHEMLAISQAMSPELTHAINLNCNLDELLDSVSQPMSGVGDHRF